LKETNNKHRDVNLNLRRIKMETKTSREEKLIKLFRRIPVDKEDEVLDFVEFLSNRKKVKRKRRQLVNAVLGMAKDSKVSSEGFAKRKQEEIDLEERRWK
jgi:hypothetical protein